MYLVLLTAAVVGGATVLGAVLGLVFNRVTEKTANNVLAFAAGIMLAASVLGLIMPSVESGMFLAYPITVAGIFSGAFLIFFLDKIMDHAVKNKDLSETQGASEKNGRKIILFVLAIAIHNFPEGLAAGVGFGAGNISDALLIAGGIALQNIPEGMVIIAPMIESGISRRRAFIYAALTGVIEIVGTLLGYMFISLSASLLPFVLSFAGGTMLYVISDDIIPATHQVGTERLATFSLLLGFCLMLATDHYLS